MHLRGTRYVEGTKEHHTSLPVTNSGSELITKMKNVTSSKLVPLDCALPMFIQFYLNSVYLKEAYQLI